MLGDGQKLFWAARGREAGETAADEFLVDCREITDDGKAIAQSAPSFHWKPRRIHLESSS